MFVTLIYPNQEKELTRKDLTKHRYLFFRRLEKELGSQVTGIWRIEWIDRKSGEHTGKLYPHFHLILFGVRYLDYKLVNECWKKAIGWEEYVRTDTKAMVNDRQALHYVAKYVAKEECNDSSLVNAANLNRPSGKDWGIHRRELLPMAEEKIYAVSEDSLAARALQEAYRTLIKSKELPTDSFSIMGELVAALECRHLRKEIDEQREKK